VQVTEGAAPLGATAYTTECRSAAPAEFHAGAAVICQYRSAAPAAPLGTADFTSNCDRRQGSTTRRKRREYWIL